MGASVPNSLNICNHFSSPIELSMSDMSSPDTRQPALTSEGELPSSAPSSGNKGREVHPLRTKQGGQYAGLHR